MNNKRIKEPISNEIVYKITLVLVYLIGSLFWVKNIIAKNKVAMSVIGVTLIAFAILQIIVLLTRRKLLKYVSVSMAMILMIAFISLFSGASFTDDFALFLAAIGLGGMYFKTSIPIAQLILSDIMLIIISNLQPQKAGEMGQFRLCILTFNVAAIVMCIMIQRGHAFIEKSEKRARDVEKVIETLAQMNNELNDNFEVTQKRMEYLQKANVHMENQTFELKSDSLNINEGVEQTLSICTDAKEKINLTKENIKFLDNGVKLFEKTLRDNEDNMEAMSSSFVQVKESSEDISEVFADIKEQTKLIVNVLKQLKNIASNTTMLSINASIEAVRAGESGKGFAVVASQIKDLAVESNNFSDEVEKVVTMMSEKVEASAERIETSTADTEKSLESLAQLKESFEVLTENFTKIYSNIEEEIQNITDVGYSFDEIESSVINMNEVTKKNEKSVNQVTKMAHLYTNNMLKIRDNTKRLKEVVKIMEEQLVNS